MLQRELFVALLKPLEHLFQRIGRLAHRRNDDEEVLLVVDDLAQVAHSVGIPHRRTAEFIDLHVISLINLTYLPLPFAAVDRCTLAADGRVYKSTATPNPSRGRGLSRRNRDFDRDFDRIYNRISRNEKPIFNFSFLILNYLIGYSDVLEQERVHVGRLVDTLRSGFAGAVARFRLDADQDRGVARLGSAASRRRT